MCILSQCLLWAIQFALSLPDLKIDVLTVIRQSGSVDEHVSVYLPMYTPTRCIYNWSTRLLTESREA